MPYPICYMCILLSAKSIIITYKIIISHYYSLLKFQVLIGKKNSFAQSNMLHRICWERFKFIIDKINQILMIYACKFTIKKLLLLNPFTTTGLFCIHFLFLMT